MDLLFFSFFLFFFTLLFSIYLFNSFIHSFIEYFSSSSMGKIKEKHFISFHFRFVWQNWLAPIGWNFFNFHFFFLNEFHYLSINPKSRSFQCHVKKNFFFHSLNLIQYIYMVWKIISYGLSNQNNKCQLEWSCLFVLMCHYMGHLL